MKLILLILLIISHNGIAYAQSKPAGDINLSISANYQYFFDTDIDDGGEFNLNRFSVDTGVFYQVIDRLGVSINAGYDLLDFDFNKDEGFAGLNPWGNINQLRLGTRMDYKISEEITTTAGIFARYSGESGAEFGDSLSYGGYIGAIYSFGRKFIIGGGIFLTSRIEDDLRVFPIILLRWQIDDKFLLSNLDPGVRAGFGPGVKLQYNFSDNFNTSINAAYQSDRFRLDNDGIAPEGVGEISSLPLWVSTSYKIRKNILFELFSGAAFFGELELDDEDGDNIDKEDFDPSFFMGGGFRVNF